MTERMGIKAEGLSVLYDPTPADEIKKRQGPRQHQGDCPKFGICSQPHMMLDYVDARYVMDKLDRLGPENWQDRYVDRIGGSVRCGIGLLVDGEWIWKWDVGTTSDIEPEKGSYSEAFKRAAVKWGIGRDLYGHKPASAPQTAAKAQQAAKPTNAPLPPNQPPEPNDADFASLIGENVTPIRPTQISYANTSECPKHNVPWKGEPGDLYHRLESGGYCRPEGQPRKAR